MGSCISMFTKRELSWEELNILEQKRNRNFVYDTGAHHSGYSSVLLRVKGTVIRHILLDPLFWVTIAVFVAMTFFNPRQYAELDDYFDASIMDAFSFFLIFVLTGFVSQCKRDYHIAYGDAMGAKGRIIEMATLVQSLLPEEEASQIVRRMNAAHLVGYTCLTDVYTRNNFFVPLNAELQVLNASELSSIDKIDSKLENGGEPMCEIVSWAMKDIRASEKAGHVDSRTASTLRATLLGFQGSMSKVFNDQAFPVVTFFFFHLVSLLCILYLPLYAWYQAYRTSMDKGFTFADMLRFLAVFVQCIFVIGLRILGIRLLKPFEDDLENHAVITFVRTGWEASNKILNSENVEGYD